MISNTFKIQKFLREQEADSELIDLFPGLEALLPSGVKFGYSLKPGQFSKSAGYG